MLEERALDLSNKHIQQGENNDLYCDGVWFYLNERFIHLFSFEQINITVISKKNEVKF